MRDLARAMGIQMIRRRDSRYVPRSTDVLVNWGQTGEDYGNVPTWLNHPDKVALATDKMVAFAMMQEACVPTVEWTHNADVARGWFDPYDDTLKVITRALTRGSQGRGMTVYSYRGGENMKDYNSFLHAERVPLYVKGFGNENNIEYRAHVMGGQVIDITQKRQRRRSNGYEGPTDRTIRSASNGWVFCRQEVSCPEAVTSAATSAVESLGLDFAAVDIAQSTDGKVCVYEVNTAPGLEGTTLDRYQDGLHGIVKLTGVE